LKSRKRKQVLIRKRENKKKENVEEENHEGEDDVWLKKG
jgi:hypothetical protein